ncbi:DUF2267 domain-containing protein [Amycolatopsis benzoatilytica]|uniref:DUF2267 domain-containing protein n=1 Tax=Amycolatopsis benzoatilytica TaxID=346045 RepID=UPI00037F5486|nr:DUF2267 domain-containing protein [Amycolatopsis benzoatilytica]
MTAHPDPLAHAHQTAQRWYTTIAHRLGTDDRPYVHRVVRTWLHLVRDRLTVDSAVHLAAQLPELLRGIYYDGWVPSKVPTRYPAEEFVSRFAAGATISASDVPAAASAVSAGLAALCSPGQLDHVFALLPESLRGTLDGVRPAAPPRSPAAPDHLRINALEDRVEALTDAISTLARGLEQLPDSEPGSGHTARAAQEAHRILLSQGEIPT